MLIGVLALQKVILKLVELGKLAGFPKPLREGGLGDLMKVKRNYNLEHVVKLESHVPAALNAWGSFAGCPAAVLNHEYLYIVSLVLSTVSSLNCCGVYSSTHSLLWTLFRVSLVSWELKVQLGPWDLQDQLVCQGRRDREVRMGSLGQLEKKVIR